MALDGTLFSPEIQSRLKTYPLVFDKSVSEKSPLFDSHIRINAKIGKLQAIELPNSKKDGYSGIYRATHAPDRLISTMHPKITSVVEAFEACSNAHPLEDAMGERVFDFANKKWLPEFKFINYSTAAIKRINIGKGLADLVQDLSGLDARKERYCIGIYGPNCINWLLTDLGAQTQSLPTVCLYDTLGPESTEYIISLTEMPVIVASVAHIPFILAIAHKLPKLKAIVSMGDLKNPNVFEQPGQSNGDTLTSWARTAGIELHTFDEIEQRGAASPRGTRMPNTQDVLTINFTSGTTGNPKGVILTHANILATISTSKFNNALDITGSNGFLSFLPLAHIYERLNCLTLVCSSVRIAFYHGNVTELLDDVAAFHPSMFAAVPRVWNRIASAIRASTIDAPGLAGMLSRKAYAAKLQRLHETGDYTHPVWDFLWTNKIRKKLGFDQAMVFVTGSAPIAPENIDLIKVAFGVDFLQGYGLTETVGGMSVVISNDNISGSVGPVMVSTEIKLRDLPEMNYTSADTPYVRGEVMIRGPQVFMGYYKNEKATEEAIDEDGFFHTGDVGMIDDLGRLHIIDRVKNFFKLAQGEYVGPERIESLYQSASNLLAQIFVEGNSLETFLVAVVGVQPETYVSFLSSKFGMNCSATDVEKMESTFCRPDIREAFVNELNLQAQGSQLKGFEKVRNVHLAIEPFGQHNDTMTPTLKVKRPSAAKLFKAEIDAMYKEGPVLEPVRNTRKAKL